MAVDVCFEAVGWLAQMFDSGAPDVAHLVRRRTSPNATAGSTLNASVAVDLDDRRQRVRDAAARLPTDQAMAIWLVDTCGHGYADAASAMGVSRNAVADLVVADRTSIRAALEPDRLRLRVR